MFEFYDATTILTLIILCITFADILINRIISPEVKRRMITVCLLIAAVSVCEWTGVRTDGALSGLTQLHYSAKYLEFILTPFAGLAAANAYGDAKGLRCMIAVVSVNVLVQSISLWTGWIFFIDANNVYHRANFYWVYVAFFIISIVYCFICIIMGNRKYRFGIDVTQTFALVLIAVGIIIQMLESDVRIDYLCISVSNLILYMRYGNAIMRLDSLTRLFNRRCYEINLLSAPVNSAIVFFDVNDFKHVNDKYGHSAGDKCLQKIAAVIHGVYAKHGSCFRIGGDEFCVIIKKNTQNLEQLNLKFNDEIERLRKDDQKMPAVALGYSAREESDKEINAAVSRADEMMYAIKKAQKESARSEQDVG
ncbi:MAG: GGDEF domain-containing protein [Candidatus Coproplasma sp.]